MGVTITNSSDLPEYAVISALEMVMAVSGVSAAGNGMSSTYGGYTASS